MVKCWPTDLVVQSSSPTWGVNLSNCKGGSIAHSFSISPYNCPNMTEILLKRIYNRKSSIYPTHWKTKPLPCKDNYENYVRDSNFFNFNSNSDWCFLKVHFFSLLSGNTIIISYIALPWETARWREKARTCILLSSVFTNGTFSFWYVIFRWLTLKPAQGQGYRRFSRLTLNSKIL